MKKYKITNNKTGNCWFVHAKNLGSVRDMVDCRLCPEITIEYVERANSEFNKGGKVRYARSRNKTQTGKHWKTLVKG